MADVRNPIKLWMIEDIPFSSLTSKPTTLEGYGIVAPYPFLRIDANQGLTDTEKAQGWTNLGIPDSLNVHDSVTLGTENGLSLTGQALSLALATDSTSGAMSSTDKLKLTGGAVVAGSGVSLTGTGAGRLLSTGDLTFSVDSTVLRTTGTQIVTGRKDIRRAGSNVGASSEIVQRYEIGSDTLYKLDLMNTQNVQDTDGEVQWFYSYTSNVKLTGLAKTRDMIGFARGAVTVLGGRSLPSTYYTTIVTDEETNALTPGWRYPLTVYGKGTAHFEGLIAGDDTVKVQNIDATTKLYVNGAIRTIPPEGAGVGVEASCLFGSYAGSADVAADILFRVKVGDKVIDLLGKEVI